MNVGAELEGSRRRPPEPRCAQDGGGDLQGTLQPWQGTGQQGCCKQQSELGQCQTLHSIPGKLALGTEDTGARAGCDSTIPSPCAPLPHGQGIKAPWQHRG